MIQCIAKNATASLEEREDFLKQIKKQLPRQFVLLNTCDRVELYHGDGEVPRDVAEHLFKVVAGLDSPLLGEKAIQGQVKRAYIDAHDKGHVSSGLHKLFQKALQVGKKVRTETELNRGAMSHGQAVIEILREEIEDLSGLNVVLIGVNKINAHLLWYLKEKTGASVFLGNRTYDKARILSHQAGGSAFHLEKLGDIIQTADILISTTSAPHYIVKKEYLPAGREMMLFDLAVPRDIDPAVKDIAGIQLFNVEQIEHRVKQNIAARQNEVLAAEDIIRREVFDFS